MYLTFLLNNKFYIKHRCSNETLSQNVYANVLFSFRVLFRFDCYTKSIWLGFLRKDSFLDTF